MTEPSTKSLKGLIIESTGSWYEVETTEGTYAARLKGKFRLKTKLVSNPIAVGDEVEIQPEDESRGEHESGFPRAIITTIAERRNHIIRKSARSARHKHIVAANIDKAFLVATISQPRTSLGFIDRFLTNCLTYHIPGNLIINKTDLLNEEGIDVMAEWVAMYEDIGFPCFTVSAKTGQGINELKEAMTGEVSLLAGHSGVGKSSIANAISPGLDLRVKTISEYSGKGQHTTTFARMHPLMDGGYLVDTPGIKEFGIVDLEPSEVAGYFPEFASRIEQCRFNNCKHLQEPGCAVLAGLEEGEIAPSRYNSYLSIYEDVGGFE